MQVKLKGESIERLDLNDVQSQAKRKYKEKNSLAGLFR